MYTLSIPQVVDFPSGKWKTSPDQKIKNNTLYIALRGTWHFIGVDPFPYVPYVHAKIPMVGCLLHNLDLFKDPSNMYIYICIYIHTHIYIYAYEYYIHTYIHLYIYICTPYGFHISRGFPGDHSAQQQRLVGHLQDGQVRRCLDLGKAAGCLEACLSWGFHKWSI